MTRSSIRRGRNDRGAVLVIFAGAIAVIVLFVAIAIDLGFGRSDQRGDSALADLASLAAGYEMAGHSDPNRFNPTADPEAACRAAIESLRSNAEDFDPLPTDSDGCVAFAATCTGTPFPPVEVSSGGWTIVIEYPVTDGQISDATFGVDGLTSGDGDPCERMGVSIRRTRDTFFAGVIGVDKVPTSARAVVVGNLPDAAEKVVPAFLMLDRTACKSIWANVGQGSIAPDPSLLYGDGILVRRQGSGDEEQAGFIHTDSDATDCGNANNDYAVYASEPSGGDTIVVQSKVDGSPGVIESTATNGRSGAGGTNVPVTVGQVVGRVPVDEIFQQAIAELHGYAHAAVNASTAPSTGTVVTYGCNGNVTSATLPPLTGSWTAYVDCTSNQGFSTNFITNATTVIFAGTVSVGANEVIALPQAQTVVVRGELAVPNGKLSLPAVQNLYVGERITIAGTVGINSAFDLNGVSPACSVDGENPSAPTRTTRIVVFNPSTGNRRESPALESSGALTMCQTTVYLAGEKNDSTYLEKSVRAGGACSDEYPCPMVATNDIRGARFALAGNIRWYAPDQSDVALGADMPLPASGGLENLAAWAEGGGDTNATEASSVSGGGTIFEYSGVFFNPNAKIELAAGNATTGPKDAQFIARAIQVNGGRFEMQPTRQNSVPVPVRGTFQLIR
jgi:hypothetical protein